MASSRDHAAPSPAAVPAAGDKPSTDEAVGQDNKVREALALMVEALKIIDSSEGAGTAGAHLDLAIHRLREWMDRTDR